MKSHPSKQQLVGQEDMLHPVEWIRMLSYFMSSGVPNVDGLMMYKFHRLVHNSTTFRLANDAIKET